MAYLDEVRAADDHIIDAMGESVVYKSGAATVTIQAIVNQAGKYASPTGALAGEIFVRISDLPPDYQKGDFAVIRGIRCLIQEFASLDPDSQTIIAGFRFQPDQSQ